MTRITNPNPVFFDARGAMIDGGKIYIGTANADPEGGPLDLFYDASLTIPAPQPIRTQGGVMVNDAGNPTQVYVDADDYSQRIRDVDDNEVGYIPSSLTVAAAAFQPLNTDLTAIAALSTTAYGRALLTLANQAALRAATGIPDPLPAAGGNIAGAIIRSGAGAHAYYVNAAYPTFRVFGPENVTDPTSQPGDLWLKPA